MHGSGIEALLSYLYFGAKPTDAEIAAQLLSFAYEYHLTSLMSVCEKTLRENIAVKTVIYILQVSMHPQAMSAGADPQLKLECLNFLVRNLAQIELAPLRSMSPVIAAQIIAVLQNSFEVVWSIGSGDGASGELSSEDASIDEEQHKGMLKTLSSDNIDKVPPKLQPTFSKALKKPMKILTRRAQSNGDESDSDDPVKQNGSEIPASPKVEKPEKEGKGGKDGDEEFHSFSEHEEESFHLKRYLPDLKEIEDKKLRSGQGHPKLQKKKRKKVSDVKDLDELFSA
jgi:hypothetical protein